MFKVILLIGLLSAPFLTQGILTGNWVWHEAVLILTSAVLLATPYLLVSRQAFRRWYWRAGGLLVLTVSLVESLYLFKEKVPFNHLALRLFLESFPQELKGYLSNVIPAPALLGGFVLTFFLLSVFWRTEHRATSLSIQQQKKWSLLTCTCLFIQGFAPLGPNSPWGFFRNLYTAVKQSVDYYEAIDKSPEQIQESVQCIDLQCNGNCQTWVLLVGESSSRHHWGCYGYWRNTTPRLAARGDLIWYRDVISSHSSTVESLGRCLSLEANNDGRHDFSDINIADIAHACGIKTWWISTHHRHGLLHSSVPESMRNAQVIRFLEEDLPGSSMPHDALMIPYLREALADQSPRKLIMLHLMGAHLPYKNRYPANFEVFVNADSVRAKYPHANTEEKQRAINAYDNATLYQDYVLDQMLNLLDSTQQQGQTISAIYFSDHGEEVYDYRSFIGHTPQSNAAWLHDIPFFTYGLPSSGNEKAPYQLNYFAHTLMDWMGIKSTAHRMDKSLLRPQLNIPQRTLGNGQPYIYPTDPNQMLLPYH